MISVQKLVRNCMRTQFALSRRNTHLLKPNSMFILSNINEDSPLILKRTISFIQPDTFRKFLKAVPFLGFNKTKLKAMSYEKFETLVDNIDYIEFIEELDLPDTFYSWFVITELHLWMLSARAMAEGDDGRCVRNGLLEALWSDVIQRVKKLDPKSSSVDVRTKIVELSEQLQASYIAYDEGILSDDIVLAGALWRRFYQQSDVDAENLEKLVKYVRRNMRALDSMSTEQFYDPKAIKWGSVTT